MKRYCRGGKLESLFVGFLCRLIWSVTGVTFACQTFPVAVAAVTGFRRLALKLADDFRGLRFQRHDCDTVGAGLHATFQCDDFKRAVRAYDRAGAESVLQIRERDRCVGERLSV